MFYKGSLEGKRILLHTCCGPCALGCIEPLLDEGAEVVLHYYNPNIFEGEFEKRLEALRVVADKYSLELVVPEHDHNAFLCGAGAIPLDREGGKRCQGCMAERLRSTAVYAREHGFDMYSTTLTVSPHKNSKTIFSLAEDIDKEDVGADFYPRDFKKRDGFLRSVRLTRELGIYSQRFCGCENSCTNAGIDVVEYSARVKREYARIEELRGQAW